MNRTTNTENTAHRSSIEAGFTLVEVLASLAIFALLSVATMTSFTQSVTIKNQLNQASEDLAQISTFRALVRSDMDALTLRPARDGLGGIERTLLTTDGDALFTFTRLGRSNPVGAKRGQAQRVRYIFRNSQFIRETLAHENPDQLDQWRGRVLLDNVENARITFVSRGQSDFIEVENWTIPFTQEIPAFSDSGAMKLTLERQGVELIHLFEIGQ